MKVSLVGTSVDGMDVGTHQFSVRADASNPKGFDPRIGAKN
jgi:hypothetical protein